MYSFLSFFFLFYFFFFLGICHYCCLNWVNNQGNSGNILRNWCCVLCLLISFQADVLAWAWSFGGFVFKAMIKKCNTKKNIADKEILPKSPSLPDKAPPWVNICNLRIIHVCKMDIWDGESGIIESHVNGATGHSGSLSTEDCIKFCLWRPGWGLADNFTCQDTEM